MPDSGKSANRGDETHEFAKLGDEPARLLEIVRDGSGFTVYGKGKFALRDLEPTAE